MAKDSVKGKGDAPITIKKYANRRLYNTAKSSYVTLDHLAQMVRDGDDFVVYDAKSGEDITRPRSSNAQMTAPAGIALRSSSASAGLPPPFLSSTSWRESGPRPSARPVRSNRVA